MSVPNQPNVPAQGQTPQAAHDPQKAATEAVKNEAKRIAAKGIGGLVGIGFIGFDTYSRMEEGESFFPALGKAAVTQAIYANMPFGMTALIGGALLEAAPAVSNAVDQMGAGVANKYQAFSGGFMQSDGQMMSKDVGLKVTMNNQERIAMSMSRHAMRNHKLY